MTDAGRTRLRLAAQNGAVRALVNAGSAQVAVCELMREVCENLGWACGGLWCPSPGDNVIRLHWQWTDPLADLSQFAEASRRLEFSAGEGIPGAVWESGEAAWIEDVLAEPTYQRAEAARSGGLHGALAVPVPLNGERRGVLEFCAREVLDPDPELLETIHSVGGFLGQFLQRRTEEAALRATEERLRFQARLLDAVGEAVIATDLEGRIQYWNAFAERLYGWAAEEVLGRDVTEVTPASTSQELAREVMARLTRGEAWSGELAVRDREGREFPVLVSDSPILDEDGRLVGIIGTSIDITDRKRQEEGQRFLAEAGRVLASSLDYSTTLRSIATLAVPYLGDWCLVHFREHDQPTVTPVARVVPEADAYGADELEQILTRDESLVEAVLSGDAPVIGPAQNGPKPLRGDRLGKLGISGILAVPLRARGAAFGVMTFARTNSGRGYDDTDVEIADELGRRAGLAIDNARLYREAEEGNRAKADFLAVVSHELRTPLNAIAGYADLLSAGISGELSDAQGRNVERIKVGAGHLAHLIDEILAYARVEAGRESVSREATDVGALAREAAVVVEPDAADKGLALEVDVPARGPHLLTDGGKVRQILVNLLSNAIKYTDQGRVRLAVRPDGSGAVFEVEDTGVGIPPEHREKIFEAFWQAESPNTRTVGGTGLGLSVSRRLARLLDGDVQVDSQVDVGSTFTVRIPDLSV